MSSAAAGIGTVSAGGTTGGSTAPASGAQDSGQAASWKQVLESMGVSQGSASQSEGQTTVRPSDGSTTAAVPGKAQQQTAADSAQAEQTIATSSNQENTAGTKGPGVKSALGGTQKKDETKQAAAVETTAGVDTLTAAALASQAAAQSTPSPLSVPLSGAPSMAADSVAMAATDESAHGFDANASALASTVSDRADGNAQFGAVVKSAASADADAAPAAVQSGASAGPAGPRVAAADVTKTAETSGIAQAQQKGIAAVETANGSGATSTLSADASLPSQAMAVQADDAAAKSKTSVGDSTAATKLKAAPVASTTDVSSGGATTITDASASAQQAQGTVVSSQAADARTEVRSIASAQRSSSRVHGTAAEAVRATTSGAAASTQDALASSMVRESGAAVATSTNAQVADSSAVSAGNSSVHATFAALDSGNAGGSAAWTQTGSHAAEAGYRDPVLGWVSVRAEQDASGVHATVIPVSQDAAQSLGTHLAGLSAYLAEHNSAVNSVAITSPDASAAGMSMGQGMSSQSGQGQQSAGQDTLASNVDFGAMERSGAISSSSTAAAMASLGSSGTYISVLA